MPTNKSTKKPKKLPDYARYSGMGAQMAVIIFLGAYGGMKLDHYYQNKSFPTFTVVLSLLAIILAMYFFIRQAIRKE